MIDNDLPERNPFWKCMANAGIFEHVPPRHLPVTALSPSLSQAAKVNHEAGTPEQPEQRINQIEPQINH